MASMVVSQARGWFAQCRCRSQVLDFHTYWSPLTGICLLGPESFEDGLKFATGGVFLLPLENAASAVLCSSSAFFSPKSRLSQVQR